MSEHHQRTSHRTKRLKSYDVSALMVLYLLAGSWIPLFLSIDRYAFLQTQDGYQKGYKHTIIFPAAVAQAFVLCGLVFSVFYSEPTYGSDADCNTHRVLALFHVFAITAHSRITAMLTFTAVPLSISLFIARRPSLYVSRVLIKSCLGSIVMLVTLMSLWITNVELLRIYNRPQASEESWVSFGQVSTGLLGAGYAQRAQFSTSRLSLYSRSSPLCPKRMIHSFKVLVTRRVLDLMKI
jgi:hypothetical protein